MFRSNVHIVIAVPLVLAAAQSACNKNSQLINFNCTLEMCGKSILDNYVLKGFGFLCNYGILQSVLFFDKQILMFYMWQLNLCSMLVEGK